MYTHNYIYYIIGIVQYMHINNNNDNDILVHYLDICSEVGVIHSFV